MIHRRLFDRFVAFILIVAFLTAVHSETVSFAVQAAENNSQTDEQMPYSFGGTVSDGEPALSATKNQKTKTITTSDGATYEITATYQDTAGIPMTGTELLVTELTEADEGYDRYLEETADRTGVETEDLRLSKVFDISIVIIYFVIA